MGNTAAHQSHDAISKRLKRAKGHLGKVITMIDDEQPCVDVARQLHAVYKAVLNAKQELIKDHIEHCLNEQAINERPAAEIRTEFAEITKYL